MKDYKLDFINMETHFCIFFNISAKVTEGCLSTTLYSLLHI